MEFKEYLQHKGMVAKTIARYERELKKYSSFLQTHNTIKETAKKKDLLNYLNHLKEERNLSNTTQNQLLGILKNYYNYASEYKEIPNIAALIKIRGIKRKALRPVFTAEELGQLCELYHDHITHYRPSNQELRFYPDYRQLQLAKYIALTLIAYQGLQPAEILKLSADSFDLRKAIVCVGGSCRGASRKLKLEAIQMVSLLQYFNGEQDKIITSHNQLERIAKDLKSITKNTDYTFMDFRQLRTSRIVCWIETEGLRKAQHLAGHKNIANTERYKQNSYKTLAEHLENYHPLN